jgi:hypothetical protein
VDTLVGAPCELSGLRGPLVEPRSETRYVRRPTFCQPSRSQGRRGVDQREQGPSRRRSGHSGGPEHRRGGRVQRAECMGAERDETPRTQPLELAVEIRPARPCRALIESIPGRSTLHEVEHSEVVRRESQSYECRVEPPARPAHEGPAGPVLLRPRRLADEDDPGREAAAIDHRVRPGEMERTQLAPLDLPAQRRPRVELPMPRAAGERRVLSSPDHECAVDLARRR